jgi:hypothetical protein
MGRRFLVHIEQQMPELLSAQHRTAMIVMVLVLLSIPLAAHGQTTPATPSPSSGADPQISPAVQKQLDAMQTDAKQMRMRIEQLEAELANRKTQEQQPGGGTNDFVSSHSVEEQTSLLQAPAEGSLQQAAAPAKPSKPANWEPFSYADWTWLNGNSREKEKPWDSKFFTPEIRFDTHYVMDFNHPRDDSMGGSSEIFRSYEVQLEQLSFGGDFHWENVRGRILTMNGMFAVTTPRNDASPARGQWYLSGAYRYISEGWGGYHFDVNHGLNIDAGIFPTLVCSAITTSTTGPTSRRMYPRTLHGFSTEYESSGFPPIS